MHILIVEDSGNTEKKFSALKERGHTVVRATNTLKALLAMKEFTPEVVFLDYTLLDANPPFLIQSIRTEYKGVRVVLITGHDDAEERAQTLGADSFLKKPFEADALLAFVSKRSNPVS